jgi:phosphomannomutase
MAAAASIYPTLDQRPVKNTVVLFDVDDTLTKPRQVGTSALAVSIKILATRGIIVDVNGPLMGT